jgi:hypothetical protein
MESFRELIIAEARELSGYCKLVLIARADREPIFHLEFTKDKTHLLREQLKIFCEECKGKELLVIFRDDRVNILSITLTREGQTETKSLKNNSAENSHHEEGGEHDFL